MAKGFKFSQLSKHVHTIEKTSLFSGVKCKLLLCSDIHFDSKKCDREKLSKHFEQADIIAIIGDFFDLMQGTYDPRKNYNDILPQYKGANYLDLVINDAVAFLKPYAHKIAIIGYGNHETNILKRQNTDPITRLVVMLNHAYKTSIQIGGYQGFIIYRSRRADNPKRTFGNCVIYYHHGSGGSAKRSKGILSNQIDGFLAPDADIICKGHDHNKWHDPSNVRLKLDKNYSVVHSAQHVLRLGSYKRSSIAQGWEVEKGFLPSKLGGWFVNFGMKSTGSGDVFNWDNIEEAV